MTGKPAANEVFKLPAPLFDARCKACWFAVAVLLLTVGSFWTLDLQWMQFLSWSALAKMGRFLGELLQPDLSAPFLGKLLWATLETLAMSALGTLLAMALGLALALPASKAFVGDPAHWRGATRLLLNALRSVPELVWATLLLIAAGLGPFAGTLALALHTSGVLGRLFAEAIENAPAGPVLPCVCAPSARRASFCTPRCHRYCRNSSATPCTGGRTTSARPRCWAWSAQEAWGRCWPTISGCSRWRKPVRY